MVIMGGAAPPTPRDLALFFARMDVFLLSGSATCRTMEALDRRIGQRRDATRAPNQARNGWRPHGRLLSQPAAPSKDRQNFVQTMGSTSVPRCWNPPSSQKWLPVTILRDSSNGAKTLIKLIQRRSVTGQNRTATPLSCSTSGTSAKSSPH